MIFVQKELAMTKSMDDFENPITIPPPTRPIMLLTPPMITTINEFVRYDAPISGLMNMSGVMMAPAMPARADPSANVHLSTDAVLIPIAIA